MIDNLVFYNKEGYQINMSNDGIPHSNIFFDKNSLNIFKTQAIYMFEKVEASNNTFPLCGLTSIKSYNTNGFNFIPKYSNEHIIEIIILEHNSIDYNTKWVYSTGIENYITSGMYVYFTGLDSYHNNDFDTEFGDYQVRKVLNVEKNRILI